MPKGIKLFLDSDRTSTLYYKVIMMCSQRDSSL